jgi:hypothetical protein
MSAARILSLVGLALTVTSPAFAGIINTQGDVFNLNATSDVYSIVYGGPSITDNHGIAPFLNDQPFSYTVTRQGTSALAAGDTITAGEQTVALQGGLALDIHSLDLTVTSAQATLRATPLTTTLGGSLAGAIVHGISGTMAYSLLSGGQAVYAGHFVFRSEDSTLTMGIATTSGGFISVFLCGGSGGVFQSEQDASGADLTILDPAFDTQRGIDAATNGLGIELAFGAGDPAQLAEPAMLPVFAAVAGFAFARRRRHAAAQRAPGRSYKWICGGSAPSQECRHKSSKPRSRSAMPRLRSKSGALCLAALSRARNRTRSAASCPRRTASRT